MLKRSSLEFTVGQHNIIMSGTVDKQTVTIGDHICLTTKDTVQLLQILDKVQSSILGLVKCKGVDTVDNSTRPHHVQQTICSILHNGVGLNKYNTGTKIKAIKKYREITRCTVVEAREYVNSLIEYGGFIRVNG